MKTQASISTRFSAFLAIFLLGLLSPALPNAQSIPLSNYRAMNPRYFNPASYGLQAWHRLDFLHQQRGVAGGEGFSTVTEYINYISPGFGKKGGADGIGNFGWGVSAYYETDHTDTRFLLRPAMAVRVIDVQNLKFSLGGALGLVNLGQDFSQTNLHDRGDPLLTGLGSTTYIDLSLSADLDYTSPKGLKFDGQVQMGELRQATLPNSEDTIFTLPPSIMASGGVQYQMSHNIWLGPRAFYHRAVFDPNLGFQIPTLDLGLRADFLRPNMWLSGSYRLNSGAVRAGMGMQFGEVRFDSASNRSYPAWAFNLGFTVPTGEYSPLGGMVEAGLVLLLPTRTSTVNITKVYDFSAAFWKSDEDLLEHLRLFMRASGPPGLTAHTVVDSVPYDFVEENGDTVKKGTINTVKLLYEFPDYSETYLGDEPVFAQNNTIEQLGKEWEGVDNLVDNLMSHVVELTLHPDTSILKDVSDDLDSLQYLVWVEISTKLSTSHDGAQFGTESSDSKVDSLFVVPYEGDLISRYGNRDEYIHYLVRFDEEDLLDTIWPGDTLTELKLACAKQYALRKRIEFELQDYFGPTVAVTREEASRRFNPDEDYKVEQIQRVFIRKLSVTSGHIYQKEPMRHTIKLNFVPYPGQTLARNDPREVKERRRRSPANEKSGTSSKAKKQETPPQEKPAIEKREEEKKTPKPQKPPKTAKKGKISKRDIRKFNRR